uniref:Phase-change related protein n=1 Tax=Leersia perrieri TaxID=77586 RepID=A0A0D9WM09_9ORYZ
MAGLLKRLLVVMALAVLMFTATAAAHPAAPAKKHGDHTAAHHESKALHKKHGARKHGGHGGHGHNKPHHRM